MVLPTKTPTTSATVDGKKATANEAEKKTAHAKATADSASDATSLSGLAVSDAYSAMHIAGGELIVAAASGDKALIARANATHKQSISNLNLATKKNDTDKKTESVAHRDFLMKLGDSSAKLGDANASEFVAWKLVDTKNTVLGAHDLTRLHLGKHVNDALRAYVGDAKDSINRNVLDVGNSLKALAGGAGYTPSRPADPLK